MYAAPVGMLGLGDAIIVTEVRNLGSGECWVRLEKETAEKFAFSTVDGEVRIITIFFESYKTVTNSMSKGHISLLRS